MIPCTFWEHTGRYTPFVDGVSQSIYKNADTGEEVASDQLPIGAMWYVQPEDQPYYPAGPDGRTLYVKTPGGDWCVDYRASNCTMPTDNEHRCWVRHGVPPLITVDKNGHTCQAGAGSIWMGSYHGFLQNGYLTNA
jgi:hypothetical protein